MRLPDYEHATGRHGASAALRNLAAYYGWGLSEAECFGLGSGLGFSFFELPEAPHKAFTGRSPAPVRTLLDRLDVEHVGREGQEWSAVREDVAGRLDAGHPAVLFVDRGALAYGTGNGGGAEQFSPLPYPVLAVGYDDDCVHVADGDREGVRRVPSERLRAAMASKSAAGGRNRLLAVTDPAVGTDVERAAGEAVEATAEYMFAPGEAPYAPGPTGVHGLAGIQRLVASVAEWPALPDPERTVRAAARSAERGGGAFRGLQAEFLRAVDHPFGADVAETVDDLAAEWTAVGETLRAAAGDGALRERLDQATASVRTLADREASLHRSILDG
ncbi:hypothetical protein BRC94_05370 [Halobacteriales archaeon QS_5_70_17]|nr:MAG: hypothetical protein BRC94_05370 [Halobacteriales archaeon QS_5_70_17]